MPTVAHDGHGLGDPADFVHPVGDVDDAGTLFGQPAHHADQKLRLVGDKRTCGLVKDQQARALPQGPRDLDKLALGHRQAGDRLARVQVEAKHAQYAPCLPLHPGPVDAPALLGPLAKKDVLGDGKLRHDAQFLMHGGDPGAEAVYRVAQMGGHPVDGDLAGIGRFDPREYLDER